MGKKTMPTAIDLLGATYRKGNWSIAEIADTTIEFAKLHVEEAKKAYFEKIKQEGLVTEAGIAYLENVYPLTNIK
jgi:methylthioribose-1-phosphate isomerase